MTSACFQGSLEGIRKGSDVKKGKTGILISSSKKMCACAQKSVTWVCSIRTKARFPEKGVQCFCLDEWTNMFS